jgi:hypothetical protein
MQYFCSFNIINKLILTIVNYYTNHLIFKNGIFFDLLKSC